MLSENKIKQIMKKHRRSFEDLAKYDETREWLIGKARIDITLDRKIIKKLKELREKTGKPVSQIIEEAVKEKFN